MRLLLSVTLGLIAGRAALACEDSSSVTAAWFKVNHAIIEMSEPGSRDKQTYSFDLAKNGDLRLMSTTTTQAKVTQGALMLISGALLIRDLSVTRGEEIDAIDAPAIVLQLTNKLLAEATKKTPEKLKGKYVVDVKEEFRPICAATMSAEAEYLAPWSIAGDVEATAPGVLDYRLTHSFSAEGETHKILYTGQWKQSATPVTFDDAVSIEGWHVYRLGPIRRQQGTSTILDYGASIDSATYKTVGELRKAMAAAKTAPNDEAKLSRQIP
ncbi:MAG TPA: hypothetical protein VGH81_14585 [Rudaea sp.]|jgi:hypothetical protein